MARTTKRCCEECEEFVPIGEGDHICLLDPLRLVVCEYVPTDDYMWCSRDKRLSKKSNK